MTVLVLGDVHGSWHLQDIAPTGSRRCWRKAMSFPEPGTGHVAADGRCLEQAEGHSPSPGRARIPVDAMSWALTEGSLTTSCRGGAGPRRTRGPSVPRRPSVRRGP